MRLFTVCVVLFLLTVTGVSVGTVVEPYAQFSNLISGLCRTVLVGESNTVFLLCFVSDKQFLTDTFSCKQLVAS